VAVFIKFLSRQLSMLQAFNSNLLSVLLHILYLACFFDLDEFASVTLLRLFLFT